MVANYNQYAINGTYIFNSMRYHLKYQFWGDARHLTYTSKDEFDRELERITDDPNVLDHTIKTYTTND